MDNLSKEERSKRMSLVKNKNTKPEMVVRKLAHSLGYRYRLHDKKLPGRPDLVFKSKQKVIFVHGCFWHLHNCNTYKFPKTKVEFWEEKLESNVARDKKNRQLLNDLGYGVLELWECELGNLDWLKKTLVTFLSE